ncbi:MAG: methylcobamide--CoM methyltransferase [Deltaproteobacteria bacterium]|jgi:[methyl-Co(III) methanol-specific corrinoid protein]:coenzyme M methyltransferase|nr:methylcobamide--CoM methyltransferase [Deltaproteobacteria bacterium]
MSDDLSPRERLLGVLRRQGADRPPVICPGGMMSAAILGVTETSRCPPPAAHHDAALMAGLARDVRRGTGFENFGLPFCMTVEPEALGAEIDFGSLACEPKIKTEPWARAADVAMRPKGAVAASKRAGVVLEAVSALKKSDPDVPVIGGLTGPLSLAASLVEPMNFLKGLRKDRESSHRVLDYVAGQLVDYAAALVEAGADVITIADPTATGEILGPKIFAEYALFYINKIVGFLHSVGAPAIVHICGNVRSVGASLAELRGDALSVDAMVSLKNLKAKSEGLVAMGNLSTYALEFADAEKVAGAARLLKRQGVDILAPACGLSTSTPLANIRALTGVVKDGGREVCASRFISL